MKRDKKSNNITVSMNSIKQMIIPLFFTFLFLKYYLGKNNEMIQVLFSASYVLFGMVITFIYMIKIREKPLFFLFLFVLFFFGLSSALLGENYRLQDVALLFSYAGLAILPLYTKLNFKIFTFLYYLLLLFFIYHISIGTERDEIFSSSANFVSELLLIAMGYHLISAEQNNKKPHLLLFVTSLIVIIWARGRSGILVFTMLLVTYPFIINSKKKYKILVVILFLSSVLLGLFYFYDEIMLLYYQSRFMQRGLESIPREIVLQQYWNQTINSFVNLILGTPLEDIPQVVSLNLNVHNSFIRLHSLYGLFGFVLIVFSLVRAGVHYLINKNYMFLVLLIGLLLRAFVDVNAFHGPFDPLIYYLILFSFVKPKLL